VHDVPLISSFSANKGPVASLAEYVQRVLDISDTAGLPFGNVWFRGVSNRALNLHPGIKWRKIEDEESLIDEFLVSLPAYAPRPYTDPWELYCLMQHHGLPTRLLDWSKSALAALFFALDFAQQEHQPIFEPVVWVMDPYQLNKIAHDEASLYVTNTHYGPPRERELVNSYLPDSLRPAQSTGPLPELPIAIEPPFSNARVLAQQGCFTVHGRAPLPINQIAGMAEHMIAIRIAPDNADDMRIDLEQLGFRGEWIYQDLDRLSKRIFNER
jgi:hypothetical protein